MNNSTTLVRHVSLRRLLGSSRRGSWPTLALLLALGGGCMWNPIEKGEPIDPTKPVPLSLMSPFSTTEFRVYCRGPKGHVVDESGSIRQRALIATMRPDPTPAFEFAGEALFVASKQARLAKGCWWDFANNRRFTSTVLEPVWVSRDATTGRETEVTVWSFDVDGRKCAVDAVGDGATGSQAAQECGLRAANSNEPRFYIYVPLKR